MLDHLGLNVCFRVAIHKISNFLHCRFAPIRRQFRKMCLQGGNLKNYAELITDPKVAKRICKILQERKHWKEMTTKIPSTITPDDMRELLKHNFWDRLNYMKLLWKLETSLLVEEKRTEKLSISCEKSVSMFVDPSLMEEGLEQYYTQKLCSAALFGQPLVFDLSYDQNMDIAEVMIALKQIYMIYKDNRTHRNPYDMYLCNVNYRNDTGQNLQHFMTHLYDPTTLLTIDSRSYLDLFPKERLVYLSPDATEILEIYDHDAIYVIGVLVELSERKPTSLLKAESEGIRTARLPLNKHFMNLKETHCLRMREVINILLEVKVHGDWKLAILDSVLNEELTTT